MNDLERELIGSLIIDDTCISQVATILKPEMFEDPLARNIYEIYLREYGFGRKVNYNVITLEVGHEEDIANIVSETITSATVKTTAELIIQKYRSKLANQELTNIVINPSNVNDVLPKLINDLSVINTKSAKDDGCTISELAEEVKDAYFCDENESRFDFIFGRTSATIGRLDGGDLMIIAARPGVGKSALVTQLANYWSGIRNFKVGFFNLEMQKRQVFERFIAINSSLELTRLRNAKAFCGNEEAEYKRALSELAKNKNLYVFCGSKSAEEIRAKCLIMNFDVIIVDYLQILKADGRYKGNRTQEVGQMSADMKALAMELNVPVICLSQLNRETSRLKDKEPDPADLRESGSLEQDASIILMLWDLDENGRYKGLKVPKNRQGTRGKVALDFDGPHVRFSEIDKPLETVKGWCDGKQEDDCPFD